jgi:hypothetical protein
VGGDRRCFRQLEQSKRRSSTASINDIKGLKGTAVNVVSMVYGNLGDDSGTGVCFSRDPSSGEKVFYGEYLMNAQGEDVVAGIRTPKTLATLAEKSPEIYQQLDDGPGQAGSALPRHAGHGVYDPAGHALSPADAKRQAHR